LAVVRVVLVAAKVVSAAGKVVRVALVVAGKVAAVVV
jgi:hypothetical protein